MADYNPTGRPRIQRGPLPPGAESISRDPSGPSLEFENNVREVMKELGDLLIKKHNDYGPKNISQSPGGPLNGLRVRMWDKLARINNLFDKNINAKNEPLEDSFADIANYGVIGLLVLRHKWDNE